MVTFEPQDNNKATQILLSQGDWSYFDVKRCIYVTGELCYQKSHEIPTILRISLIKFGYFLDKWLMLIPRHFGGICDLYASLSFIPFKIII